MKNIRDLIQQQLTRIAKEIKETLNDSKEITREGLILKATSMYNLTKEEQEELREMTKPNSKRFDEILMAWLKPSQKQSDPLLFF